MRTRQSRRPTRLNIEQKLREKDKDNRLSKDDLFDLDSIPMEVLYKSIVSILLNKIIVRAMGKLQQKQLK